MAAARAVHLQQSSRRLNRLGGRGLPESRQRGCACRGRLLAAAARGGLWRGCRGRRAHRERTTLGGGAACCGAGGTLEPAWRQLVWPQGCAHQHAALAGAESQGISLGQAVGTHKVGCRRGRGEGGRVRGGRLCTDRLLFLCEGVLWQMTAAGNKLAQNLEPHHTQQVGQHAGSPRC